MQTKGSQRSKGIPKVLAAEGNAWWHMGLGLCLLCKRAKVDAYWKRHSISSNSEDSDTQKSEAESNILIQFRTSVSLCARMQPFLTAHGL